ncbi:MAG TPA: pilin [Candidatus Paceibacterota bacterium]|nr:pilin [Candidatus Paceibacterota bacterium]
MKKLLKNIFKKTFIIFLIAFVSLPTFAFAAGEVSLTLSPTTTTIAVSGTVAEPLLAELKGNTSLYLKIKWGTNVANLAESVVRLYANEVGGQFGHVQSIQDSGTFVHPSGMSGLTPGTKYYFDVIRNDTGASVTTGPKMVETLPAGTVNSGRGTLVVNALGGDGKARITLTASNNPAPLGVIIHYGTDSTNLSGRSAQLSVPTNSSISEEILGLQSSTTYYYKVVDAVDATYFYTSQASFSTNASGVGYGVGIGAAAAPNCEGEGVDGYCLLAPLGGISVIRDAEIDDYFGMIYRIAIGLAGTLAVLMIFFGGVQYMTSDALQKKNDGRKRIWNAVIGLIIALSSYAILNTVNPRLLEFTFGIDKITVGFTPQDIDTDIPQTAEGGKFCTLQNGGQGYASGSAWGSDAAMRTTLAAAPLNVTVKTPICTTVGQQACTTVTELNITGLQKLRTACPSCELVITGGTECWLHSRTTAHGKRSSVVDLRSDQASVPNLNAFVKTQANRKGEIPGWGTLYVVGGIEFVDEGDHFHIWGWNGEHVAKYPRP